MSDQQRKKDSRDHVLWQSSKWTADLNSNTDKARLEITKPKEISSSPSARKRVKTLRQSKKKGNQDCRNASKNAELNHEADKSSVGLLPCSLNPGGYSVSISNAKRQNRGEQRRLANHLSTLDDNVKRMQENILTQQKEIIDELLEKYPDLKKQICLVLRDKSQLLMKLGLPRIRTPQRDLQDCKGAEMMDHSGVVSESIGKMEDYSDTHHKLQLNGVKCFQGVENGSPKFPKHALIFARPVPNVAQNLVSPTSDRNTSSGSTPNSDSLELPKIKGSKPNPEEGPSDDADRRCSIRTTLSLPSIGNYVTGNLFKLGPSFVVQKKRESMKKVGGAVPDSDSPSLPVGLKVSYFIDSDFGFHQNRLKPGAGMSLRKKILKQQELRRDIAETAEKHIHACQASSLCTRGSKAEQSMVGLRNTLDPDNAKSWHEARNRKKKSPMDVMPVHMQRNMSLHRSRTLFWSLPNIQNHDSNAKLTMIMTRK